jgi:ribulose-phosphate 3-epimerase
MSNMFATPVVPATIPTTEQSLRDFVALLASVHELHVDVVDGRFVPYQSWPYAPVGVPTVVSELLAPYTLEVDLMVVDPLPAARAWLEAGADMLVFHTETISLEAFTQFVAETGETVGISALNDTPHETLRPYLAVADYVQVMGIAAIGAQGQPFDERAITRIEMIRQEFPKLPISLDGSVNMDTLPRLASLRLARYIVGSAVTKAVDPVAVYRTLTTLVSSTG